MRWCQRSKIQRWLLGVLIFESLISDTLGVSGAAQALDGMRSVPKGTAANAWLEPCHATPWPAAAPAVFSVGETLAYAVHWGPLKAGDGVIRVESLDKVRNRPAYHVSMTLGTTGVAQSIHAYREKTDTWIDRDSLLPVRYQKVTREGDYARDEDVRLDPACGRLNRVENRLDKHRVERKQAVLPGPTFDILGYIFYLRSLPLAVGREFPLTLVSGDRLWPVTVRVKSRLKIATAAGWFDCFYIVPTLRGDAGDTKLRDVDVWLTADTKKIPVRIRMDANIGHIMADLVSRDF